MERYTWGGIDERVFKWMFGISFVGFAVLTGFNVLNILLNILTSIEIYSLIPRLKHFLC